MRTAVADTSIDAYRALCASPKLSAQQRRIVSFLADRARRADFTRRELSACIGMDLSSVCGRVAELRELGVLEQLPRRRCNVTFESSHPLRLAPTQAELELVAA